jgi:hypothetical protein
MTSFGAVPDVDLSTWTEVMSREGVIVPATGRAASNFNSDSTVVDRPARAEFCSRRFNTRRDTRVVESLYTHNQYSKRHLMISDV